jgi:hypothetical protein
MTSPDFLCETEELTQKDTEQAQLVPINRERITE